MLIYDLVSIMQIMYMKAIIAEYFDQNSQKAYAELYTPLSQEASIIL